MISNTTFESSIITYKCNAILKTGNRKNEICGANKKKDVIIDGFLQPRCNRHIINNKFINEIKLNKIQKKAYELCINSEENIFITGSAGVGKSLLIRNVKKFFDENIVNYVLTSSTGISSLNIDGQTVQSFFGLKSYITKLAHVKDNNKLIYKLNRKVVERIKKLDILIIDEISMLDSNIFDIIEYISRKIKKNKKLFGGIKLILVGDFFQLPPTPDYEDRLKGVKHMYCFKSIVWEKLKFVNIILNTSYRQKNKVFYNMLLNIRLCKINNEIITVLNKKIIKFDDLEKYEDWTILFSSNYQKDKYNNMKLNKINNEYKRYKSLYKGNIKYNKLFINIPDNLFLKIGAYIMLTKNIYIDNILYINGDKGKIIGFDEKNNPIVIFDRFPIIKNVIKKQEWNIYNMKDPINPKLLASKIQYPIVLSWAITIHKSQGLSLDKVIIDFSDIFLNGQAYVALSRCKSLKNLKLLNFDYKKITVNNEIINFYNNLNFIKN